MWRKEYLEIFAPAVIVLAVFLLALLIWLAFTRVSMEKNALFMTLYREIEGMRLSTLFVNSYMACCNFQLDQKTVTTERVYTSGRRETVGSVVTYVGRLQPDQIMDFNKMGYRPIPQRQLRQLKRQLWKRVEALPQVSKIEEFQMEAFTPPELFANRGSYGAKPSPRDLTWKITYQYLGAKVTPGTGGKKIG